jgi:hypothetical protein
MEIVSRRWLGKLALLLLMSAAPARAGAPAQGAAGGNNPDLAQARREMVGLEGAINGAVSASFNSAPFALTQHTKGAYLRGYGMALSFVVNIHRALINTPFGEVRRDAITPEQKKKRIEDLKERLMRVLFESGDGLRQLGRDETLSIVAFFEDRNFPDEQSQNKTVILSVFRRDLEGMGTQPERWTEFKQRVRIVEY